MYTLRCTQTLLRRLAKSAPIGGDAPATTTKLGDWYANRLNVANLRLVLCTSSQSLLCVVVPAAPLLELPSRLVVSLAFLLLRIGVPQHQVVAEIEQMRSFRYDKTQSRSILASMNDFTIAAKYYLHSGRFAYLSDLDFHLSETPCGPLKYHSPAERASELLSSA